MSVNAVMQMWDRTASGLVFVLFYLLLLFQTQQLDEGAVVAERARE